MIAARKSGIISKAACLLLGMMLVFVPRLFAVEPAVPSSVDVYWKSTRAIAAPGVTNVIVLDEEIAHIQLGNDMIEVAGLSRGDTVALAYVNGAPVSIIIHVIEHPMRVVPPSLLRRESELAHGVFGSDFQTSSSGGNSSFVFVNSVFWSQQMGDNHLDVTSQFEDNTQFGGHSVNLRTGGVVYRTPQMAVNVLDFNQSVSGMAAQDRINNFSSPSIMQLRGVGVTLDRGKNEYSFFAGSTIPSYFLSLDATRDVVGFTFHRAATDRLNLFGGTTYVNIPLSIDNGLHRRSYIMQTAGVSYRIGKGFLLGAQAGISNGGGLLRVDASYSSYRLSGYGSAILASQTFPLNQLQSLFSGTSSLKGGINYRTTPRLNQGFYFEHTTISPGLIYRFQGSSDYLSPTFSFNLSRGETLNVSYAYSRNTGGFTVGTTTGNRYDFALNSQVTQRISNTAQVSLGSVQDPLQINSQDQFSVRDSISIPIKGQTLLFGVEHDSVQASLISKLNSELSLLSPALQAEFLANPTAFIDSSNFPPEIKALLAAEQPTGTTFSASGNITIGSKLRLNPNLSFTHTANGSSSESWTETFGYSASFLLRPTLQLRSALTNVLLWNSQQNSTQRTTILSAGFQKSFAATPGALPLLHRSRVIQGRVFRDLNINGIDNVGEPGIPDIEVRLDDGQTAITDAQGSYRFLSVSSDQHMVSLDLTQFHQPVRMTTRGEAEADLIQQHSASVNFGILDFARVMGNVYNDLRFENHRQPDSKGLQGIALVLDNGTNVRKAQTTGSGDFELDNIPPGDYKLSLDSTSVPANYIAPVDPIAVHVSPVSTVLEDIPMRALRSISGRVLLRMSQEAAQKAQADQVSHASNAAAKSKGPQDNSGTNGSDDNFAFIPLADVQIQANATVVKTDESGNFLIRNLPAGKVAVSLVPVKPIPDGIKLPSGEVNLPTDPIQVQGASIVISNLDLVPYLTEHAVPNVPALPAPKTSPILQGKMPTAAPSKASIEPVAPNDHAAALAVKSAQPSSEEKKAVVAIMSASVAKPAIPNVVAVSALPSSLNGRAAQTPLAIPRPPASAQPQQVAAVQENVASPTDCSQLQALGDIARCYAQRKKH